MTRRSKREIEKALAALAKKCVCADIGVTSEVVEITKTDVDSDGTVDDPAYDPPEDAVAVELDTDHDAVSAHMVQSDGGAES